MAEMVLIFMIVLGVSFLKIRLDIVWILTIDVINILVNCMSGPFKPFTAGIISIWLPNGGTVEFLDGGDGLNLYDRSWRIFSKNPIAPPQFVTENARVNNSMIVDGCYVDGEVDHSILSTNVDVQRGSKIVFWTSWFFFKFNNSSTNVSIHDAKAASFFFRNINYRHCE